MYQTQVRVFSSPEQLWDSDQSVFARLRRSTSQPMPIIGDPLFWQNNMDAIGSQPNIGATAQFFNTSSVLLDGRQTFVYADKEGNTKQVIIALTEDVGILLIASDDPARVGMMDFRFVNMHDLVGES